MKYLLATILSFSIVFILTPILMKLAFKYNFTDKPTKRKKHRGNIPRCGGISMVIGFFIPYFIIFSDHPFKEKYGIFIGALLILIIGIVDDYHKSIGKEFAIIPRLIVQLLAAIIVYKSGVAFHGFTNPFTNTYIVLSPIIQFLLTVTWIFGVTTVINWSDGMDGLAGSISIISAMTMFVVALAKGQFNSAYMSITLVGSILAFLRYNRHPARVFMGDSGANFLGFILAIIALEGAFKQATALSILVPVLALGVPIFDNIFVIFRRFQSGKPVYEADRSQIHYRLQERGMSVKQIVSYICILSGCLSLVSLLIIMIIL